MAGDQDTRQDSMGLCARLGAVTAIRFARDDGGSDHPFGLVIGGVQTVDVEETQQVRAVFSQAPGKAGIVLVRQPTLRGNQLIQSGFQVLARCAKVKGSRFGFSAFNRRPLAAGQSSAGQIAVRDRSYSLASLSDLSTDDRRISASATLSSAHRHTPGNHPKPKCL